MHARPASDGGKTKGPAVNRSETLTLIKNSTANLARGSAAAVVALALPPFLTRALTQQEFAVWSLVLQVSALAGYVDFGISTAIGRQVALLEEKGEATQRDETVSTALFWLCAIAAIVMLIMAALAWFFPMLFRSTPPSLLPAARWSLLMIGGALAVNLPAAGAGAVFIGRQKNEVPAMIVGVSKLLSALAVIVVAKQAHSLIAMSAVFAGLNLAGAITQFVALAAAKRGLRLSASRVTREAGRSLYEFCASLTVWSLAMLLITGLDVTIVGHFRFDQVAYYTVAASLVAFLAGAQNMIFNAMIQPAAVMYARNDHGGLGKTMIVSTGIGTFLLLLVGTPLYLWAEPVLRLWVGQAYAARTAPLLRILIVANVVRLSATPYVIMLIGVGEQKRVTLFPILEGATNFASSVVMAYFWGAKGVALGTLLGAAVGVSGNLLYNMRRTVSLRFRRSAYLRDGYFRPMVCTMPVLLIYLVRPEAPLLPAYLAGGLLVSLAMFWYLGLAADDRKMLSRRMHGSDVVRP